MGAVRAVPETFLLLMYIASILRSLAVTDHLQQEDAEQGEEQPEGGQEDREQNDWT